MLRNKNTLKEQREPAEDIVELDDDKRIIIAHEKEIDRKSEEDHGEDDIEEVYGVMLEKQPHGDDAKIGKRDQYRTDRAKRKAIEPRRRGVFFPENRDAQEHSDVHDESQRHKDADG